MKRPLAFFSVCFCVTQFICFIAPRKTVLLLSALFLVAIYLVLNKQKETQKQALKICVVALLSSIFLNIACEQLYFRPLHKFENTEVELQGYYEEIISEEQSGTARIQARITHANGEKLVIPMHVTAFYMPASEVGTTFSGTFQLSTVQNGQFMLYNKAQGITGTIYPKQVQLTGTKSNVAIVCSKWRASVGEYLRQKLGTNTGALVSAMTVGDKMYLSSALQTPFRKSGISHLLVISGLHLSLVAGLVLSILNQFHLNIRKKNGVAIVFIVLFMALVGFTPSVSRAGVMLIISLLAPVFKRESDAITTIAFTAFLLTLCKPYIVLNIGFLLSIASVSAILLQNEKVKKEKHKTNNPLLKVKNLLILPLKITLFTIPVLSFFGGGISWVSPFANLLVIPFVAPVVICAYFGLLFSVLPVLNVLSIPLFWLCKVLMGVVFALARWFASLPLSTYYIKGFLPILCVVSVFLIFGWVVSYNKAHKTNNEKQKRMKKAAYVLSVLFLIATSLFYSMYMQNTAQIFITAQSQSVIIVKNNICMVVYNGNARQVDEVAYILEQNNIDECEYVLNLKNENSNIVLQERLFAKEVISLVDVEENFTIQPISGILCYASQQKNGTVVFVNANGYTLATYTGEVTFGSAEVDALVLSTKPPYSVNTGIVITKQETSAFSNEKIYMLDGTIQILVREKTQVKYHKEYF